MPPRVVNTPDGPMRIAGSLRPPAALITDLLMCFLVVVPFAHLVGATEGPAVLIWGCAVVAYCLLSFRGVLPSLGRWALGLRQYPYEEVEEYGGKGTLYVYEDLRNRDYTLRTVATVLLLAALYGIALLITMYSSSGPA